MIDREIHAYGAYLQFDLFIIILIRCWQNYIKIINQQTSSTFYNL